MDKPFVFMTIPLIIGIIFSYYIHISLIQIIAIMAICLIIYIINIINDNSNGIVLSLIFCLLGMVLTSYSLNNSILMKNIDNNLIFNGIVDNIVWQEEDQGKYIIKIETIIDNETSIKIKERTVLKIIGENKIQLGDRITFRGKLKAPMENTNPMLFNYKLSLLSDKIHTTMTIKDYSIEEISSINKPLKYKIKAGFRDNIEDLFNKNLNGRNSSLMKSIILGEYSYLDEENIEKYRDLGLAHILAVSGLHIGIIAGSLTYIMSNLGINRKMNIIITLSIIWFYGYLIGFPPSLLRANIMFSIIFYGESVREPYDSINSLFFAMFILLIINPMWIFNLGFQLSFMATFSIIYLTPKIQSIFYPYNNKITYGLSGILGVQIGLLPVQAYYFNQISILSIASNLIIGPILSLSLIIGAIMIVIFHFVSILAPLVGKILDFILSVEFLLVEVLYDLPFGMIGAYSPQIIEIILYYILLLIVFRVIKIDKFNLYIKRVIISYLVIVLIFTTILLSLDESIEIHFIDVGQGDSILINTKEGNYLVDTGGNIMDSFDIGKNITFPYLQKIGINKLKGVFITHFDEDHCKSLPLLMDNMNIDNILISYEDNNSEIYNEIKGKGTPLIILKQNDVIWLDKNTSIEVLGPSENLIKRNLEGNDLSLVFLLSYYDKEILFTGDIEKEGERELISKLEGPIDIIKVPHHGSNTSSTEELLNKLRPSIGVVSVGRNNFYGHPREEVINRYEELGTEIYRTDTMGMVKIKLDKEKMDIDYFLSPRLELKDLYENLLDLLFYIIYYLIAYVLIKFYLYLEEELRTNEL